MKVYYSPLAGKKLPLPEYLLGTPETSLSGLRTLIALRVLRSTPPPSSSASAPAAPAATAAAAALAAALAPELSVRMVM